nr:hypothetical protein [Brucella abortus]
MAYRQQRLERDHGFVVFAKIAAKHEYLFTGHGFLPEDLKYVRGQFGMDARQRGVIGLLHRLLLKQVRGIFAIPRQLCQGNATIS